MRPLRNGDVETVQTVFERLGERSRRARFNGAKPLLSPDELGRLSTVDATRHALVGYVAGDDRPAGIARLVRDGATAEIAFEVADEHQGRGIGSALAAELLADARAAGFGDHRARCERQRGRDVAAAPDARADGRSLRRPGAVRACDARVSVAEALQQDLECEIHAAAALEQ